MDYEITLLPSACRISGRKVYATGPAVATAKLTAYLRAQVDAGVLAIDDCEVAAAQFIEPATPPCSSRCCSISRRPRRLNALRMSLALRCGHFRQRIRSSYFQTKTAVLVLVLVQWLARFSFRQKLSARPSPRAAPIPQSQTCLQLLWVAGQIDCDDSAVAVFDGHRTDRSIILAHEEARKPVDCGGAGSDRGKRRIFCEQRRQRSAKSAPPRGSD